MKILKCLIMGIIILTTNVFCLKAQTFDTTQYYGKMNYVFANVDKSQVTTGFLEEYGCPANRGITTYVVLIA